MKKEIGLIDKKLADSFLKDCEEILRILTPIIKFFKRRHEVIFNC